MRLLLKVLAFLLVAKVASAGDLSENKVKVLLNEWAEAQNSGAFSRYERLYARGFNGIRRSGTTTMSFDRAGWLQDRKRMFRKAMSVEVKDLKIEISGSAASVHFKQVWQSGSYRDIGDKVIVITAAGDSLLITREEMLNSTVGPEEMEGKESSKLSFAFAISEGVVIPGAVIDLKAIKEMPKLERRKDVFVAYVDVNKDQLPLQIGALTGKRIRFYSRESSCDTQISGFKLISKEVPHQSQVLAWQAEHFSDDKIADAVFLHGNRYLVATTVSCSGDFARESSLPVATISQGVAAETSTRRIVKDALRSLPLYTKRISPNEAKIDEEAIKVFTLQSKGKKAVWISAFVSVGDPCGDGGTIGSLWKLEQSPGGPKLVWIKYLPEDPIYATDIDDDGFPDFYYLPRHTSYKGFINGRVEGSRTKAGKVNDEGNLFFEETALHDDPC